MLSNIALNRLEKRLGDWAENQRLYRPNGEIVDRKSERRTSIHYVRYADDFVIMNYSLEVVWKCKKLTEEFLRDRNLELSDAKTKVIHTRLCFDGNKPGFEILGFKIKHFNTKRHGLKDN